MIEQLKLYITYKDHTTRLQSMLEEMSAQFLTWFKSQGIIVVDFLPQNIKDSLIESRGSTFPMIDILYTDNRIVRQSGEAVFSLLREISKDPGQFIWDDNT